MGRTRLFLSALVIALAVVGALAQSPPRPAPLAASVEVKVIDVDVTVSDAAGNPVVGLTKDDFEVLEDNLPKKITNFYVIRKAGSPVEQAPATDVDKRGFRRKVILLVDNNFIQKRDRDVALNKLQEFVAQTFDRESDWSLATIGQMLEIVQPLTNDKAAILAAIGKARHSGTVSMRSDMDREILSDPFRRRAAGASYDYDETVRFSGRERTERNARALANTARGITDATRAYSAIEGKKIIVLLTGGMELNTGFAAYEVNTDRELRDKKTMIAKLIEEMVREANAANIAIHVINVRPREMAAPQHDVENSSWGGRVGASSAGTVDTSDVDSAAFTLSASTGGLYLTSSVVRQSLDSIEANTSNYYSLGYSPSHSDDRKYHTITVRLNKPDLRAVHRRGYLDISPDEQLEQFLRLRISVLQPSATIPVKLEVAPPNRVDGKPVVQLTAAMPFENVTMLQGEGQYKGRVHIYLSIFDKNGSNVGFHHRTQDVVLSSAQHVKAIADSFRYRMNVRLDQGEFTVAVTLRDDLSREIGTAVQKLRL